MTEKAFNITVPEGYVRSEDDLIFKIQKKRETTVEGTKRCFLLYYSNTNVGITLYGKTVPVSHFYKVLMTYGLSKDIPCAVDHQGNFVTFDWNPHGHKGRGVWNFKYMDTECSLTGACVDIYIKVHTKDSDKSTEIIKKLFEEIASSYTPPQPVSKTLQIYTTDLVHQVYQWTKYGSRLHRDISTIYINEDLKRKMVKGLTDFYSSSELYDRFGVTWKYVQLFHGPPGSGKTSTAIALASIFNKNLAKLTITPHLNGQNMEGLIKGLPDNTFLLIEDVDALFVKREGGSSLDFSTLLNCLDGITTKRGMVVIMTTNHRDKLDPAFLRPGRIDQDVEFFLPGRKELQLCLETLAPDSKHEHGPFLDKYSEGMSIPMLQRHLFECIKSEKKSIMDVNF
jgi:hypothetical protein